MCTDLIPNGVVFVLQAYIDFEIEQEENDKARSLYERLLERTQHVKVWMSFAQFELTLAASQQEDPSLPVAAARAVFQRANKFAFLCFEPLAPVNYLLNSPLCY
jgi:crooked neck